MGGSAPRPDRQRLEGQVEILYRRARGIRLSILLAGVSVLLASVLIIVLFLTALWKLEVGLLMSLLFIACMAALSGSLVAFIRDINLSLGALKLEMERSEGGEAANSRHKRSAIKLPGRWIGAEAADKRQRAGAVDEVQQRAGGPFGEVGAGIERELLVGIAGHVEDVLAGGLRVVIEEFGGVRLGTIWLRRMVPDRPTTTSWPFWVAAP